MRRHKNKHKKCFGAPLAECVASNRSGASKYVPDLVVDVIEYLEKHEFTKFEGLFRVSGSHSRLEALKESYDRGKPISFEAKMEDPFTIADLLLTYLRSLPVSLFSAGSVAGELDAVMESEDDEERVRQVRALVWRLPTENRATLDMVFGHGIKVVEEEEENKMGLKNVVIVFTPSLYCNPKVCSALLQHHGDIFSPACEKCGSHLSSTDYVAHVTHDVVHCGACNPNAPTLSAPVPQGVAKGRPSRFSMRSPKVSRQSRKSAPLEEQALGGSADVIRFRSSTGSNEPKLPPVPAPRKPLPSEPQGGPKGGVVFGVPMVRNCKQSPGSHVIVLPSLVRQCWKYVEARCSSPVYEAPGDLGQVSRLRMAFDEGSRVNLKKELAPLPEGQHVAAHLLLEYIGSLPESVFSDALKAQFEMSRDDTFQLSRLMYELPLELRTFLLHLVSHIRSVTKDVDDEKGTKLRAVLTCFAQTMRVSLRLTFNLFSNRRTIMQPKCSTCGELTQLHESPRFDAGSKSVTCVACQSKR